MHVHIVGCDHPAFALQDTLRDMFADIWQSFGGKKCSRMLCTHSIALYKYVYICDIYFVYQ